MSMARLLITAVRTEHRSVSEVAGDYHVSRRWVHELLRRFDIEGEAAFEPRSRRPHRSPNAVSGEVEDGPHLVDALQAAVRIGDDTDTVAAIAGGQLGVYWGTSAVPEEWKDVVHGWPGL